MPVLLERIEDIIWSKMKLALETELQSSVLVEICKLIFNYTLISIISYLSYSLHCGTLPDKRCLSHGICLYQVMMTLLFLMTPLVMLNRHKNRKLRHNR